MEAQERTPLRVLVLCTGNSCRSQMAEAFLRREGGDRLHVASAGSAPHGVHPLTIEVMAEVGVDLRDARSTHLDAFRGQPWDYVITVCDSAAERCPLFPGPAQRLHWPFDDPPAAPEAIRRQTFRRVRDQIEARVRDWLATLPAEGTAP